MPYAAQQDMINRFGEQELIQLTDREGAGVINTAVLDAALADATAEINGYMESESQLPFSSVPKILILYCCNIARYNLYEDRVPEDVRKRYEDAVKYLRMVSQGKISMGVAADGESVPEAGGPDYISDTPVFSRDGLADY